MKARGILHILKKKTLTSCPKAGPDLPSYRSTMLMLTRLMVASRMLGIKI